MAVELRRDTEQRLREEVDSGQFGSVDEVVDEGLRLIKARRAFQRAVEEGERALSRGDKVTPEESRARIAKVAAR